MAFRPAAACDTILRLPGLPLATTFTGPCVSPAVQRLMPNSILPYGWMLFAALAFATMGTLIHALGASCDWQIIALSRTALALVFATALTLLAGARLVFLRPRTLWVRSFAGSISLVCTFYALTRLPVADVLTLTNVFPIWVALLSWPLLREAPGKETWIAIACGIFGVVLVQQPHFQDEENTWAAMLALFSSFTTAISMLGLHRLQEVDPRAIVVHFSGVSLVVCLASLAVHPKHGPGNVAFRSCDPSCCCWAWASAPRLGRSS